MQVVNIIQDTTPKRYWIAMRDEIGKSQIVLYQLADAKEGPEMRLMLSVASLPSKVHVLNHADNRLWIGAEDGLYYLDSRGALTKKKDVSGAVRFFSGDGGDGFFFGGKG
ncbi:hypothetical protein RZS08_29525, partial [Arthrospira platensis SPKY1]|nr:hypothetical protein [Arthrospira platensis SPKY1]